MSHHPHKRHRSRSHSRSSVNKRESEQNRNNDRSKDYARHADSYDRHHHSTQLNKQYNHHHLSDSTVSVNEMINRPEEYPPIIQSLVYELLLEQKKRKLVEDRLNICKHEYTILHARHEQTMNHLTLLKHDFDKCRIDLKTSFNELNELRHLNGQLRLHIDHLSTNERQQMYTTDEIFHSKRQRRH